MKTLIRIVFVIFIAKGFDCLASDICCIPSKDENISKEENITAESLVNEKWFKAKENKPILKIFEKEDDNDNVFISKDNGDKISIKLDEKGNTKIVYQNEKKDSLKLNDQKYVLFKIETKDENTVYLYCSDVESKNMEGIFKETTHVSISVIACDTEKVENMAWMFKNCFSLKKINFGQNFNTKNVIIMSSMFFYCENLTNLDLKNFNTSNVKVMTNMFSYCSSLINLDLQNFNTENVTVMAGMFDGCSSLKNLNLNNFNTIKVKNIGYMFCECQNLTVLNFGENFKTSNIEDKQGIFWNCINLSEDTQNKILN